MMFDLDDDQIDLPARHQREAAVQSRPACADPCIRVQQARALAAWSRDVSEKAIDSMVARGSTYAVPVPEDVRVALVYSTRFPDEHGEIFLPDVLFASDSAS
jgi:murein L,D-transpeptidase YcbB/YkuD